MKITSLHIGQRVRHPEYGSGTIKSLTELTASILFDGGDQRAIAPESAGLEPLDAQASENIVEELTEYFDRDTAASVQVAEAPRS